MPAAPAPRPPSDSVRVAARKVYELLDVVGEADLGARRVEQTTVHLLSQTAEQARWASTLRAAAARSDVVLPPEVTLALHRLLACSEEVGEQARGLRELVEGARGAVGLVRDGAMGLAMVPVRRAFAALPRIARDVAAATGKDLRIETSGEDVELDKQVLDGVADALKHLVINAVDHGCETPGERRAAGKPAQALVTVSARSVGGTVVLEVADDGAGVDEDRVRAKAVAAGLLPADSVLSGPPLLVAAVHRRVLHVRRRHRHVGPRRRARRRPRRRRGAGRLRRGQQRARLAGPRSSSPCPSPSACCAAWWPGSATSGTPCRSPASSSRCPCATPRCAPSPARPSSSGTACPSRCSTSPPPSGCRARPASSRAPRSSSGRPAGRSPGPSTGSRASRSWW